VQTEPRGRGRKKGRNKGGRPAPSPQGTTATATAPAEIEPPPPNSGVFTRLRHWWRVRRARMSAWWQKLLEEAEKKNKGHRSE
jgi:hypothetical protein